MSATAEQRTRRVESRMVAMVAMAERLFNDFDEVPVTVVFHAISFARSTLRQQQMPATPEAIEALARRQLRQAGASVG